MYDHQIWEKVGMNEIRLITLEQKIKDLEKEIIILKKVLVQLKVLLVQIAGRSDAPSASEKEK